MIVRAENETIIHIDWLLNISVALGKKLVSIPSIIYRYGLFGTKTFTYLSAS